MAINLGWQNGAAPASQRETLLKESHLTEIVDKLLAEMKTGVAAASLEKAQRNAHGDMAHTSIN